MSDGGAFNDAFEQLCGTFNIGEGHGQGVEVYAHEVSILTVRILAAPHPQPRNSGGGTVHTPF